MTIVPRGVISILLLSLGLAGCDHSSLHPMDFPSHDKPMGPGLLSGEKGCFELSAPLSISTSNPIPLEKLVSDLDYEASR